MRELAPLTLSDIFKSYDVFVTVSKYIVQTILMCITKLDEGDVCDFGECEDAYMVNIPKCGGLIENLIPVMHIKTFRVRAKQRLDCTEGQALQAVYANKKIHVIVAMPLDVQIDIVCYAELPQELRNRSDVRSWSWEDAGRVLLDMDYEVRTMVPVCITAKSYVRGNKWWLEVRRCRN